MRTLDEVVAREATNEALKEVLSKYIASRSADLFAAKNETDRKQLLAKVKTEVHTVIECHKAIAGEVIRAFSPDA